MTIGCIRIRLSLDPLALPPHRGFRDGEVPSSDEGGGVMGDKIVVAHDPSARCAGTSPAKLGRQTMARSYMIRSRQHIAPDEFTMLTVHRLNDRICAHSTNAAHAIEVP